MRQLKTITLKLLPIALLLFLFSCSKSSPDPVAANNPLPVGLSMSPANMPAGSAAFSLAVTGTGFVNGSVVKWNGAALNTTFVNATHLSASVPATLISSPGTGAVTVFSPVPGGGNSASLTFTITNTNTGNPVPVLTSLSPASISAGSGSFTLTATGANFISSSQINWNGSLLATTFISATELTAVVPGSSLVNAGNVSVFIFTPLPGGGNSSIVTFTITPASTAKRILFDASHAETAGNADWVIDEDGGSPQTNPTPAQSTVTATTPESYWTGALSSWGIDLVKQGNIVHTLPAGSLISYGNIANAQDLSNYDVFVVDEPNKVFTAAEKTAILNFVNNGGGLFMVSDHTGSDRDNDGWDSPAIWNDLMSNNSVQNNPFGFQVDLANFSDITSNVSTVASTVLSGSQGTFSQLQFNNGTTATINPAVNANVKGLIWKTSATHNNSNIMSLTSGYGTGRVFFVGDSSPIDDGTGDPGNSLFPGWSAYSHRNLFMNATLWLAKMQ